MESLSRPALAKAAAIQAVVNTIINGVINYFMIRGKDLHAITADSVTSGGSDTVIGHAIFTAMILAVIFTLLGYRAHRSLLSGTGWPQVIGLAVKNAIYAFGIVVIAGVLWQKMFPDVQVGTVTAAGIAGLIAGVVSGVTHFTTLSSLADREAPHR